MFNFFKKKVTAKDLESFKETLIEEIKNLFHNNDAKEPGEIVKKAVLSNTTLMVVTKSGSVYNNTNASKTLLDRVLAADNEHQVAALMQPELSDEDIKSRREEKLKEEFQSGLQTLIDKGE